MPRGDEPQANEEPPLSLTSLLWRVLIIAAVFSSITSEQRAKGGSGPPKTKEEKSPPRNEHPHFNAWKYDAGLTVVVYTSNSSATFTDFETESNMLWLVPDLTYSTSPHNFRVSNISLPLPPILAANGTELWAHVFVTLHGSSPNPSSPSYNKAHCVYTKHQLTAYLTPPTPAPPPHNLLFDPPLNLTELAINASKPRFPELHWKPSLDINLVVDHTVFPPGGIPAQIQEAYIIRPNNKYLPPIYVSEFWLLTEQYIPVNNSVTTLPLTLSFTPQTLIKWQITSQIEKAFLRQHNVMGERGGDEFKRMLTENHPALLALTFCVSTLHTIFDLLAFKNDIQFWKHRKTLAGLSVRTIFLNIGCSFVIFLYLVENDTSWLILTSTAVGLAIEVWKIQKAVIVEVVWVRSVVPMPWFKEKESYKQSGTSQHDAQAIRALSWVLYPCVIGYSIYSLYSHSHRSWYSWVLSSLVGAVYTFGFILMTPQLWINYKLKSVENMNWRVLMYRSLNTFIDDLFAFVIRMPTMHRLSCFRDDIVFLIYIYQRWIYPADPKRTRYLDEEDDANHQIEATERKEGEEQETVPQDFDSSDSELEPELPERELGAGETETLRRRVTVDAKSNK